MTKYSAYDKLDIYPGDLITVGCPRYHYSTHIVTEVHKRAWNNQIYGVMAYTLRCDECGLEDGMSAGTVTPLYLEEFLQRNEENFIEVQHVYSATPRP